MIKLPSSPPSGGILIVPTVVAELRGKGTETGVSEIVMAGAPGTKVCPSIVI